MRRRAALVLLALAAAAGPLEAAAATGLPPGAPACASPAGRAWVSTPAPDLSSYANPFFDDGDDLLSHALDPVAPQDRWVASSGAVLRTGDGGCSWEEALVLPEAPTAELPYARSLHRLDRLLAGGDTVLAVGTAFPSEVVVVRSEERGARGTWRGVPTPTLRGNLLDVAMAPSDPDRVYVVIDRATVALAEVHVSGDGGRTWSLVSSLDATGLREAGALGHVDLAVDERDSDALLLSAGGSGVLRSGDGGRTFDRLDGAPVRAGGLAARNGTIAVADRFDPVVHLSRDDGRTWSRHPAAPDQPFRVLRAGAEAGRVLAVQGPSEARFLDETGMSVWRWDAAAGAFADITPPGRPLLLDAVADATGAFVLHGPRGLWTWYGDVPAAAAPDAGPAAAGSTAELRPAAPPPPAPARLDLPPELVLQPGTSRAVPVRLTVPPRPRDLDLAMLFDTTNSMSGAIDAVRRDAQRLVDTLAAGGYRPRFGVAEFQDYPLAPWGRPTNRPYRRLRELGAADAELRLALGALSTAEDLDVPTSGLTGLLQVATGRGQTGLQRAPGADDPEIAPGQGMAFRRDAVKVVLTLADEPLHDDPAHPGPTLAEAVTALRQVGALAVGVAVTGRPVGAADDLRAVATGTGALAPRDLACGERTVGAGEPLVCEVGAAGLRSGVQVDGQLVEAVSALVSAVPAPAAAAVRAPAPRGLTTAVTAAPSLDLRETTTVRLRLTVGCAEPLRAVLPLTATVAGEVVARATLPVRCGSPLAGAATSSGEAAAVARADRDPPVGIAAAPAVPPPPVAQVPAPAPAQAPAPAAQGAPGTVTGLAAAPDQDGATAPAVVTTGPDRGSVPGSELPLAAVPVGAGALATAALCTHLVIARRRPATPVSCRKDPC